MSTNNDETTSNINNVTTTIPVATTSLSTSSSSVSMSTTAKNIGTTKKVVSNKASNKKPKTPNYTHDEIMYMLENMKEVLPVGGLEWERVVNAHNALYPERGRDKDSLKRKFSDLHRKKPPTGDPNIPEEVREAKIIKRMIVEKVDIDTGSKEGEEEDDDEIDDEFKVAKFNDCFYSSFDNSSAVEGSSSSKNLRPSPRSSPTNSINLVNPKKQKRNYNDENDFHSLFLMQMQADARREERAREEAALARAETTRQNNMMMMMMMTMMGGRNNNNNNNDMMNTMITNMMNMGSSAGHDTTTLGRGGSAGDDDDEDIDDDKILKL